MTLSNDQQTRDNAAENQQISLLEEKLVVARRKQKVGEVLIHKQVETKVIKVPIRREKLVVKRIGKEPQQLTEVLLTEESINGFKYGELTHGDRLEDCNSKYISLTEAQALLSTIKELSLTGDIRVSLRISSNCTEDRAKLEEICQLEDIDGQ